MQIVYLTFGSRGDTQPHIAFAVEVCRMVLAALRAGPLRTRNLLYVVLHFKLPIHPPCHSPHAIHISTVHLIHLHTCTARALHSHLHRSSNAPVQLVRAGHEVRLYIAPEYLSLVPTLAGLSVTGSQQTVEAILKKVEPYIANGNQAAMLQAVCETSAEFFAQEADAIKAVCEGWAEVVIFNQVALWQAFSVTKVLNIKLVGADVKPVLPTRELFPFSGSVKLPKFMNLFIWWLLAEKIFVSAPLNREIEKWQAANGCKQPARTNWDLGYRHNTPQICGFSLKSYRLDTPPADWKLFDYAITGDWVLSADDLPEKPHAALVQFIEAGVEPPLYIGWGSMAHESGQYMTELAVRALHAVGKRGIIFEGSSGSELFRLGLDKLDASKPDAAEVAAWAAKNVLVTGGVSHEWLFPKVAAIVHHGGAGTSAASFRAGVPSLVTPFGFDQFEYARLTIAHGLGPGPLPEFKAISPKQLGAALVAAVTEPRYKAAAAALRDQMHRERGTKLAVEAFERMSHRHIWKEEAERQQRGVTHALTPPAIVNWDLVLICAVLFAVAAYMLSAWLLEEAPPAPVAAPIACSWDWRALGCPPGCKMLFPGACKRA